MKLQKRLAQQALGLAGLVATGAAIALPLSAQTSAPVLENKPSSVQAPKPMGEAAPGVEMATPEVPVAPSDSEAPAAEAPGTVVEVAAGSETFKTLVAALTKAELTEVLSGEGPFTVFAPTDEAFAALPEGTVEKLLLPENREALVKVLTYHVVPGAITSENIAAGEVATVEGSDVTIAVEDGKVTVEGATVIEADIVASNGVIHAIDKVMLPAGVH